VTSSPLPKPDPVRVIVADDDPIVRGVLCGALRGAGIVVIAEASSGRDAVELALHYRPDVVVMDVVMPGYDGVAATREIHAKAPEVRVLVLTMSADDHLGVLALRVGGSGFLRKDDGLDELPDAVLRIAAGEAVVAPMVVDRLIDSIRRTPEGGVGLRPVSSVLTAREWEVLDRLCLGHDVDTIATEFVLSPETVRSHIKRIMRKLGVHTRADAVKAADELRRT
jgi:DNA-binding NarL/FixJ family response regulator